jgi:outer membrane receptor protein involved in Fe transport
MGSYVLVDYIGTWQLGKGNALGLAVENLFNAAYFPVTSQLYPTDSSFAAGRGTTFSFGYTVNW